MWRTNRKNERADQVAEALSVDNRFPCNWLQSGGHGRWEEGQEAPQTHTLATTDMTGRRRSSAGSRSPPDCLPLNFDSSALSTFRSQANGLPRPRTRWAVSKTWLSHGALPMTGSLRYSGQAVSFHPIGRLPGCPRQPSRRSATIRADSGRKFADFLVFEEASVRSTARWCRLPARSRVEAAGCCRRPPAASSSTLNSSARALTSWPFCSPPPAAWQ